MSSDDELCSSAVELAVALGVSASRSACECSSTDDELSSLMSLLARELGGAVSSSLCVFPSSTDDLSSEEESELDLYSEAPLLPLSCVVMFCWRPHVDGSGG